MAEEGTVKFLSLEDIVSAADCPEDTVDMPEWGGAVKIRGLTKGEQQTIRKQARIGGVLDDDLAELLWVAHGLLDPVMSEKDVGILRGKSVTPVERLLRRIYQLSGILPEGLEEAQRTFRARSRSKV